MKLAALAVAIPALLIAGTADAKPRSYRAVGTEPFWTLEIGPGSITYKRLGNATIITATPRARPTANGRRYVTPRITIDVTRGRCNDGMGERTYPEQVKVTIGGSVVMGCGGDPLVDENLLQETRWTIVSIDGRPVRSQRSAEISFADGQLSGSAGCNRINAAYTVRGGALSASRIVSTRMACLAPGVMATERTFISIITGPATLRLVGDDTITLTSRAGTTTLRQVRN